MTGFLTRILSRGVPQPPAGFTHDLDDNLPSPTSGSWHHSRTCPHCRNSVSHNEWMVEICESCGQSVVSCLRWRSAATRSVVINGEWEKQRRIGGVNYILAGDKRWVRADEFLAALSQGEQA